MKFRSQLSAGVVSKKYSKESSIADGLTMFLHPLFGDLIHGCFSFANIEKIIVTLEETSNCWLVQRGTICSFWLFSDETTLKKLGLDLSASQLLTLVP
jgi:hypothetical protein